MWTRRARTDRAWQLWRSYLPPKLRSMLRPTSLQYHGGYGFAEEYDIQLYYRRAKGWALQFGDPSVESSAHRFNDVAHEHSPPAKQSEPEMDWSFPPEAEAFRTEV